MRRIAALSVLVIGASVLANADASLVARRDKALEGIKSCLRRNEVSRRECKHLKRDVTTLVDVYRSGDKSVLPTLLHFTYLTDFYDEALLSDPEGFLTAMRQLPQKDQQAVAAGIAGGCASKPRDLVRFKAMRAMLKDFPSDSPNKALATLSLIP